MSRSGIVLPLSFTLPLCSNALLYPIDRSPLNRFASGGNAPSYTYRLLSEYYHEDDYEL